MIIIGGGGHASVLTEILIGQGREILAVISPEDICQRDVFEGILHLKNDDDILLYSNKEVLLVNGIGMMPNSNLKEKVNSHYFSLGYKFETVVSDFAYVSPFSKIGEGAQILPSAIVHTGATIGKHTTINTAAIVEHDSIIGDYNHLAPNVIVCGQVKTGKNVFIGAGSIVVQNISIEQRSVIKAGSVIKKDIN